MTPELNQDDYNTIVDSLDAALSVFEKKSANPEAELRDFVENHYFKLWRAICRTTDCEDSE